MTWYSVCLTCSHTKEGWSRDAGASHIWRKCDHCGEWRLQRVVRQIQQPDGSVIEVSA